jgi:hypothetical protein
MCGSCNVQVVCPEYKTPVPQCILYLVERNRDLIYSHYFTIRGNTSTAVLDLQLLGDLMNLVVFSGFRFRSLTTGNSGGIRKNSGIRGFFPEFTRNSESKRPEIPVPVPEKRNSGPEITTKKANIKQYDNSFKWRNVTEQEEAENIYMSKQVALRMEFFSKCNGNFAGVIYWYDEYSTGAPEQDLLR